MKESEKLGERGGNEGQETGGICGTAQYHLNTYLSLCIHGDKWS